MKKPTDAGPMGLMSVLHRDYAIAVISLPRYPFRPYGKRKKRGNECGSRRGKQVTMTVLPARIGTQECCRRISTAPETCPAQVRSPGNIAMPTFRRSSYIEALRSRCPTYALRDG